MTRYIDADKLIDGLNYRIESLTRLLENRPYDEIAMRDIGTYEAFIIVLNNEPTADVEEVKHGEWILHDDGSGTCNLCNTTQKHIWDFDNFQSRCGKCGAKMDGK